jgi:hypothetical protein
VTFLRKWLSLILAGLVVVSGWQAWQLYQREQEHLGGRVQALAIHAAQFADATRVLQEKPDSEYDRYRAVFHGRAFEIEAGMMPGATIGPGCTSRSICPAIFSTGELSNEHLRLFEQRMFRAEDMLNSLSAKRHVSHRDLDDIFAYLEQALQEIWDARH